MSGLGSFYANTSYQITNDQNIQFVRSTVINHLDFNYFSSKTEDLGINPEAIIIEMDEEEEEVSSSKNTVKKNHNTPICFNSLSTKNVFKTIALPSYTSYLASTTTWFLEIRVLRL